MMPLTFAETGEEVEIIKITGKDEVRLHLAELGMVVGTRITIISKIGSNMIVNVKGSRIALDERLGKRIMF